MASSSGGIQFYLFIYLFIYLFTCLLALSNKLKVTENSWTGIPQQLRPITADPVMKEKEKFRSKADI